ncbi:hypothetical protein BKA57DRAFT_442531 [Linnemannia elongata]|nr:hypothetical protein BKA57DRAFT_442531 [Linnemannia elongata]
MAAVKNNQPKPRILTRRAKGRCVSLDPRDYQPVGKGKKRALQAYTGVTKKSSHKKAIFSLEDSAGKDRFEKDDINRIMDWLDDPLNYGAVYGFPGTTPPPGTPVMNSNTAYGNLADTVNRASGGRFRLNAKSMRERWGRHKFKYVATKKIVESTGFGTNDADRAKRIFSIAAKKEKLCLGYQRMDAIFGTKPNITPLAEYDSTLSPAETQPADPYYDLDLPSEWDRDDYEMHGSHKKNKPVTHLLGGNHDPFSHMPPELI